MFGLFKGKSELEKLNDKYGKLLKEAHSLSTVNRQKSDEKLYEANLILRQIEILSEED